MRDWGGPLPDAKPEFLPEALRKEVHSRFSRAQGRRKNRRARPFKGIAVEETQARRNADAPGATRRKKRGGARDSERGPELVSTLKESFKIDAVHLLIEQEHEEVA